MERDSERERERERESKKKREIALMDGTWENYELHIKPVFSLSVFKILLTYTTKEENGFSVPNIKKETGKKENVSKISTKPVKLNLNWIQTWMF